VALVPVSPLSPQDCHMIYHRNRAEFSRSEFCAWDEGGDTCTGDMGGPLIAKQNGAFHLIGLKSYAQSKVTSQKKNTNTVSK
jgi:coagulation factor X